MKELIERVTELAQIVHTMAKTQDKTLNAILALKLRVAELESREGIL